MENRSAGRRNRTYVLPKDALEGDRLDLQHHLLRFALKGDYAAPVDDDLRYILDVGSGTGIWGEEMAVEFPDAVIVDFDLDRPAGTVRADLPGFPAPNHRFVQGNVLQTLPFRDDTFDFTHQRVIGLGVPAAAWVGVVSDLIRVTRPGGWVELMEIGMTYNNAGPVTLWLLEAAKTFLAGRGLSFQFVEGLADIAKAAGLCEVVAQSLDLPLGSWDPYIGLLLERDVVEVWKLMAPMIASAVGVPPADLEPAIEQARKEWAENRVTMRFVLVYGHA